MDHLPLAPELQCQKRRVLGPGNWGGWGPRRFANGAARFFIQLTAFRRPGNRAGVVACHPAAMLRLG